MRKILFRGKDSTGKWQFGDLLHQDDKVFIRTCEVLLGTNFYTDVEVDAKTVGEFTGAYDKDGKEIFESDTLKLVKTGYKPCRLSVYDYYEFVRLYTGYKTQNSNYNPADFRVIGNIFDDDS